MGLLRQLDCNEREAQTYLHCLSVGPASVQQIAHGSKQNRLTAHSTIEQLIEKGFLYESRKGKRRLIVAREPATLMQMVQKKQNELSLIHSNIEHMLPLLNQIYHPSQGVPSVKFYEDVDGLKVMLEETLEAKGEVLVFSYIEKLAEVVGADYLEDYFKRRAKKGIKTRLILPPCPFADRVIPKSERYNIQVQLLPQAYQWSAGFFLWNDKVAWLSYTQGKRTTTIIENRDIAQFVNSVIFQVVWKSANIFP